MNQVLRIFLNLLIGWRRSKQKESIAEEPRRGAARGIFRFYDGESTRCVDPLEVWSAIWMHPDKDFQHLVQDIETIDPERQPKEYFEAQRDFVEFVREVFEVKPLQQGGLTYQEIRDLVADYLEFMEDIKKKHDRLRTGLAPTDSSQVTA